MFGPKLDSRSYTQLLLIVIAVLLAMNLFAQRGSDNTKNPAITTSDSLSDTESLASMAAATREVAAANKDIASAIRELADSVGNIKLNAGGSGSSDYSAPAYTPPAMDEATGGDMSGEAGAEEEATEEGYEGTFTIK